MSLYMRDGQVLLTQLITTPTAQPQALFQRLEPIQPEVAPRQLQAIVALSIAVATPSRVGTLPLRAMELPMQQVRHIVQMQT